MLRRLGVWCAVAMGPVSGCAGTAAYDGPTVPQAELAHLEGDRVAIRIVDDNRIADSSVEILSGEHTVTVSMATAGPSLYGFRRKLYAEGDRTVCFTAFKRRRYVVQPAPNQSFMTEDWRAAVFDSKAEVFVDHPCPPGPWPTPVPQVPARSPLAAHPAAEPAGPPAAPVRQRTDSE